MQFKRWLAGRAGLLTVHTIVTNEHWFGRIREVINLGHAAHAPVLRTGDEISDAGIAFPPALMRAAQIANDDIQARGLLRCGDIPHFMLLITEHPQHIDLGRIALRQLRTLADARHLPATGLTLAALARNMHDKLRLARIGNIDYRRAVVLQLAILRIHACAAMQTDVCDPATVLLNDGRLIGTACLQVVKAHHLHVPGLGLSVGTIGIWRGTALTRCQHQCGKACACQSHELNRHRCSS